MVEKYFVLILLTISALFGLVGASKAHAITVACHFGSPQPLWTCSAIVAPNSCPTSTAWVFMRTSANEWGFAGVTLLIGYIYKPPNTLFESNWFNLPKAPSSTSIGMVVAVEPPSSVIRMNGFALIEGSIADEDDCTGLWGTYVP